jgi:hypothetical protein
MAFQLFMEATRPESRDLYRRRLHKESDITDAEVNARTRWNLPILSANYKCSVSLDLPLQNCVPTKICRQVCYAAQGRQYYRRSVVKSLAVNRLIQLDPEHAAHKMVDEAAGRTIRFAGSGELLPGQVELASYVEQFGGDWWGFTRRPDTHRLLPSLMSSFDATTPARNVTYIQNHVPTERRAYLRRPVDPPSPLDVAVTFPVHGPMTAYTASVPFHDSDRPFDRNQVDNCWSCRRCY